MTIKLNSKVQDTWDTLGDSLSRVLTLVIAGAAVAGCGKSEDIEAGDILASRQSLSGQIRNLDSKVGSQASDLSAIREAEERQAVALERIADSLDALRAKYDPNYKKELDSNSKNKLKAEFNWPNITPKDQLIFPPGSANENKNNSLLKLDPGFQNNPFVREVFPRPRSGK